MQLNYQQASTELFTNNYNNWRIASPPVNTSNPPATCNSITKATFNSLARQWDPENRNKNSYSQRNLANSFQTKEGIHRWVTSSVSTRSAVDFHAYWHNGTSPFKFLWHFKLSD